MTGLTQKERRRESERRIIAAAIELFAARGYAHTTLVQIGNAAGCTGTLISNRFGSKEGLLRVVLAHIMSRFETDDAEARKIKELFLNNGGAVGKHQVSTAASEKARIQRAPGFQTGRSGSAREKLDQFVQAYLEDADRKQSRIRALHVIMGEALGGLSENQRDISLVNELFRAKIKRLIAGGIASGDFNEDVNIEKAAVMVVGLLRGVTTQALAEPDVVRLSELIPTVQSMISQQLSHNR